MKQTILLVLWVAVAVFIRGTAMTQDFIIYPDKGQSQQQLEQDKFECYTWAKQQTGFDPMQMPTQIRSPRRIRVPAPLAEWSEAAQAAPSWAWALVQYPAVPGRGRPLGQPHEAFSVE